MKIYNAVLTGSRVLVLGPSFAALDVCRAVLGIAQLLAPPFSGILPRTFPYANLTDLEFLSVPGYIAGVTNPMFQGKKEWWDVLCDLSCGNIILNGVEFDECDTIDRDFAVKVIQGVESQFSEEWVRAMFEDYTKTQIIKLAFGEAISRNPDIQSRHVAINNKRITKWASTECFKKYKEYRDSHKAPVWARHVDELILGDLKDIKYVEEMYSNFVEHLVDERTIQDFLADLPEMKGGVHLLAQGLFSPSQQVQQHTVEILNRIQSFPCTREVIRSLNTFLTLAYDHHPAR